MGVITPFITDTILCGRHHDLQAKGMIAWLCGGSDGFPNIQS